MSYQIVQSSPQAMAIGETAKKTTTNFPFEVLEVGQSFLVPVEDFAEQTIRNAAAKAGKKLSRRFCVVKHSALHNVFEVGRLA